MNYLEIAEDDPNGKVMWSHFKCIYTLDLILITSNLIWVLFFIERID